MMEPADADNDEPLPDRLEAAVGSITVLPRLTGIPLGHDCSWKGSQVSRLAALQTGGIGRDRYAWGAWWAEAMSDLGADIAASAHNAAINGMWDAGYLCISHNVSNADRRTDNPLGSGVALAIKREVAADWTEVTPGPHGRALGGSIRLHNGAVLRVVAVYGPTGACLPGFTQNLRAVQHETDLVTFLQQQVAMAQAKDWTLVVLGDLNSFTDGALDKWQGQWQIRDECLAVQCREMGLIDTWRDSHPTLPGFTYVSPTGSASRLDSIWILPAIGFHTPVLNSALLWNWHKRVDHHPVLIDLGIDIPTVPAASSDREQPRWRKLADMAHGHNLQALRAQVEAQMDTHRPLLMQAAADLTEASTHGGTSHATLSEIGMVHGQTPALSLREVLCSRVHQAHDSIMAILHQTLPTTNQPSMDRKLGRAQNAWDTCLALLRSLKHILIDSETYDLETANSILNRADVKWRQGLHFLDKRGQVTIQRDPWDWDGFHTQLDRWLSSLSAPGAPQLRPPDICQPAVDAVARNLHWAPSATETADRILLVEAWIQEAQTLRAKTAAHQAREGHERRVHLLRSGDLRRWARCWRTPAYKRQAYTPQQITTASGTRRPKTPAEMRKAAAQEWQKLFDHPSRPWSHELVHTWTDPSGFLRGSPKTHDVQVPPDVLQALLSNVWWSKRFESRYGGFGESGDCGRASFSVLAKARYNVWCISMGSPHIFGPYGSGSLFRHKIRTACFFCVPKLFLPLLVWGRSLHMKDPGGCPRCRPPDLDLLDGSYAICISTLGGSKTSFGFLLTPNGGWRPLTMLEEAFKAIEGPVTHRLVSARAFLTAGSVFSAWNRAYEPGQSAASDVLYLDVQVCEDSLAHHLPLARVPADFEKFFNTVNLHQVDAVQQARGLPDPIRQLYQAAFQGLTIQVDTKWGLSDPVHCHRGIPQGAASSPELSKPAQDPLLRLRENSTACYVSSAGRRDLSKGSQLTGIGFAWDKFHAFATDWDIVAASPQGQAAGFTPEGIPVSGYDIWAGAELVTTLPRARDTDEELLLGKRGTFLDRHSAAAEDILLKLDKLLQGFSARRFSWDELILGAQVYAAGYLNYAPLVGIPHPQALHRHDSAVQQHLLRALHVRSSAERVGLLAARSVGGLQLFSAVEGSLASVAAEVMRLLSSLSPAGQLARDALKEAMSMAPEAAEQCDYMIVRALRHLAGYGIFVNSSMDRTVCRILDHLADLQGHRPPGLIGPFEQRKHTNMLPYCRVGRLANAVRSCLLHFRNNGIADTEWGDPAHWFHLPANCPASPQQCAAATTASLARSCADWALECELFGVHHLPIAEDWSAAAWEHPQDPSNDLRSQHLDSKQQILPNVDIGLFADGGANGEATVAACQARAFAGPHYWNTASAAGPQLAVRLPARYGWEHTTVHTAELLAMLAALRWRRPGAWNLLVLDRASLFPLLQQNVHKQNRILSSPCLHLVSRVHTVTGELSSAWRDHAPTPLWRAHQLTAPETWHVQGNVQGRSASLCSIPFLDFGLVGVHVRSHQANTTAPAPVIVEGNERQDEGCRHAYRLPQPPDVWWPSSGLAFQLSYKGRAVTDTCRNFTRKLLRQEARDKWKLRPVQGKIASVSGAFLPGLDLRLYVSFTVPNHWARWLLPSDRRTVDLSAFAYRCLRASGGWTERLHSDTRLQKLALRWADFANTSARTCPLCLQLAGTPRHVVMSCPAMRPMVHHFLDDVEAELVRFGSAAQHSLEAARRLPASPKSPTPEDATRWPILTAWRWLVPMRTEIADFAADAAGSSAVPTRMESGTDLAYRGVLPAALGRFITRTATAASNDEPDDPDPLADESFSSSRDMHGASEDVARSLSKLTSVAGAGVSVLRLLFLGLRSIRAEYLKRIAAWADATEAALDANIQPAPPLPLPAAPAPDAFLDWFASSAGLGVLRELRWLASPVEVALARLRGACRIPGYRPSDARLRNMLLAAGVPSTQRDKLSWMVDGLPWELARVQLSQVCQCPRLLPAPLISCCITCRGAQMQPAVAARMCPWCRQDSAVHCQACGCALHFRGACAWNRGANRLFLPTAEAPVILCPDCHWAWMRARAALPWRQAGPETPSALTALVVDLRGRCSPGAGLHSSKVASTFRQRLRRHLRRWLSPEWKSLEEALRSFRVLCQPVVLDDASLRAELTVAADALVRSDSALKQQGADRQLLLRGA
ncbi:unnamed protein product [Symbiodinium sp. CCMP2592]|nr:unnamed protein product [Symbiodinium sp. CCMP2592]